MPSVTRCLSSLLLMAVSAAATQQSASRFAIVRPFAPRDASQLAASFNAWNNFLPCTKSPVTPVDLFLSFSQDLTLDATASAAVQAVLDNFERSKKDSNKWGHCIQNVYAISMKLSAAEDVYDPDNVLTNPFWVYGPNLQFLAIAQGFQAQQWGAYSSWYLMEMDSIPRRSSWLPKLLDEVDRRAPFAILGSVYQGDNWDRVTVPDAESLFAHINGNAVYNSSSPLTSGFVRYLDDYLHAPAPINKTAFDLVFAEYFLSQQLSADQFRWYAGSSDVIGNFAHTSVIDAYLGDYAIVHGALQFESLQASVALVVSDFGIGGGSTVADFEAALAAGHHPYVEVVEVRPKTAVRRTRRRSLQSGAGDSNAITVVEVPRQGAVELDLCNAPVSSRWFTYTDLDYNYGRRVDLLSNGEQPVVSYIPAQSALCADTPSCGESLSRAAAFSGVQLVGHFEDHFMIFNTILRDGFCKQWTAWNQDAGAAPTADDYAAYVFAQHKERLYTFVDKTKAQQREWGVLNGEGCPIIPQQEHCADAGCTWHPSFETCFNGSLPAVPVPPSVSVSLQNTGSSSTVAISIQNKESQPLTMTCDATVPYSCSVSQFILVPRKTTVLTVQWTGTPSSSGIVSLIVTNSAPQLSVNVEVQAPAAYAAKSPRPKAQSPGDAPKPFPSAASSASPFVPEKKERPKAPSPAPDAPKPYKQVESVSAGAAATATATEGSNSALYALLALIPVTVAGVWAIWRWNSQRSLVTLDTTLQYHGDATAISNVEPNEHEPCPSVVVPLH